MLGEPRGTVHLSMLFIHQTLQDGPTAQPVKSLSVLHFSCQCYKISIKKKTLKCSLHTWNTLPQWSRSRGLWIAPITSIWLALSCSPFLCFHYRLYKTLPLLGQIYILLATTIFFCLSFLLLCVLFHWPYTKWYKVTFPCAKSVFMRSSRCTSFLN